MPPDWSNVAISLALVRGKGERVDGRHLAGCKRATELRYLPLLFGALSFRALDSFLQLLLERGQDLIPALGLLLVLLIAVQPKRSIGAQENQEELSDPPPDKSRLRRRRHPTSDSGRIVGRTVRSRFLSL